MKTKSLFSIITCSIIAFFSYGDAKGSPSSLLFPASIDTLTVYSYNGSPNLFELDPEKQDSSPKPQVSEYISIPSRQSYSHTLPGIKNTRGYSILEIKNITVVPTNLLLLESDRQAFNKEKEIDKRNPQHLTLSYFITPTQKDKTTIRKIWIGIKDGQFKILQVLLKEEDPDFTKALKENGSGSLCTIYKNVYCSENLKAIHLFLETLKNYHPLSEAIEEQLHRILGGCA